MSVGNHEVWGDPKIEGVLSAVPYLKKFGVTPENLIYKFDFNGARFIFLWSGKYDYRSPSKWDGDRPLYAQQVKQMQQWLDEAKAKGIRKAFINFHYPVFARSGMGPIPAPDNPHSAPWQIAARHWNKRLLPASGNVDRTERTTERRARMGYIARDGPGVRASAGCTCGHRKRALCNGQGRAELGSRRDPCNRQSAW